MQFLTINHFYNLLKTSLEIPGFTIINAKGFIKNSFNYMDKKINFNYTEYNDLNLLINDLLNHINLYQKEDI